MIPTQNVGYQRLVFLIVVETVSLLPQRIELNAHPFSLAIPSGLEPLLPIYQRGILYGTPTIREASAAGLGEVISLTATKFLAGPLIIKMTGPLLRIVGDRNPSNVKIAILRTLGLILVKGGPALRAFVPQFQTTFVKALSDPSRQVRMEAIGALGLLMPLSTRVDPLLKELVAGSLGKNSPSADAAGSVAVQTATLDALAVVLQKGGSKAKLPDSIPSALEASKSLLFHADEYVREAAAKVLGAACDLVGAEETVAVVQKEILSGKDDESSEVRQGKACAIRRIFSASVSKDLDASLTSEMRNLALKYMKDDKTAVKEAGCIAVGAAIGRSKDPAAALRRIEPELLAIMNDTKERMEYHIAVAQSLCLALTLSDVPNRVEYFGLKLLDACLTLSLSSAQRTQFAYHDVLFLALDVAEGKSGLDKYASLAMFDDAKRMKSLYTKVLYKIKAVTVLKD
jgi:HEAT repeat protein